jgi:hypothetical protein
MSQISRDGIIASVNPGVAGAAYSSGDVLGTPQKITDAFVNPRGLGIIRNVVITDTNNQKLGVDLLFFNADPGTLGGDNAALDITDLSTLVGRITVAAGDYTTLKAATNAEATKSVELLLGAAAGVKDLWVALIARGGPTYLANGLKAKIAMERL